MKYATKHIIHRQIKIYLITITLIITTTTIIIMEEMKML